MQEHIHDIVEYVFPPHYVCWNERADIIALHAVGDGLTVLAYYIIPVVLFFLTRQYHFHKRLKFIFFVYGMFIFLCGTTHLFDVLMIWYISEDILLLDGWLRVITGIFSIFSAGVTIFSAHQFLTFAANFLGLTAQMRADREAYDRISSETWQDFNEATSRAEQMLHVTSEPQ